MEQRKNNIFAKLLLNSLKSKKNWFFLSTVIIFVTTLLIPYILKSDGEFFIVFGLLEVFILVFINCLVDNSFLHNDSKLAYYKSKPVTFREHISINIIINLVFATYLLLLIVLSVVFQNLDYRILESFKFLIPWLSAGIFLASLSSILAGNTLVAGVMTIFNFALPGIIFLILQFMFSILENIVAGFNANVLMEYFVRNVYRLEYIYFVEYSDKSIDFVYFLLLGIILAGITLLIFKMLKRRKNENTGNFIAFDGYKYFVSVLACLIVPASFSLSSIGRDIISEITVSLLMAALTYYIIIAVMEKSFKISRLSIKVFISSMAVFVALTGGTVAFAGQYKNVVPAAEDVEAAYVGSNSWIYNDIRGIIEAEDNEINEESISEIRRRFNVVLFTEKESIETITKIHKEILSDKDYKYGDYYANDLMIVYYLKDGSSIVRSYKMNNSADADNIRKDEIASELLNSQEFKRKKYFYLYDEYFTDKNNYNITVQLRHDGREIDSPQSININDIKTYLLKDIEEDYYNIENAFMVLSNYNYEPVRDFKEMGYFIEIYISYNNDSSKDYYQTIYINKGYENTKEYLKIK